MAQGYYFDARASSMTVDSRNVPDVPCSRDEACNGGVTSFLLSNTVDAIVLPDLEGRFTDANSCDVRILCSYILRGRR